MQVLSHRVRSPPLSSSKSPVALFSTPPSLSAIWHFFHKKWHWTLFPVWKNLRLEEHAKFWGAPWDREWSLLGVINTKEAHVLRLRRNGLSACLTMSCDWKHFPETSLCPVLVDVRIHKIVCVCLSVFALNQSFSTSSTLLICSSMCFVSLLIVWAASSCQAAYRSVAEAVFSSGKCS